jgi:hypothetical protein
VFRVPIHLNWSRLYGKVHIFLRSPNLSFLH